MTTRTATLAEFVLARIEADQAAAEAATAGRWSWGRDGIFTEADGDEVLAVDADRSANHEADATHIARHDPARVLAQCGAYRAIVEEHADDHNCVRYIDPDDNRDCFTLRALASIWADHESFDEAWSV